MGAMSFVKDADDTEGHGMIWEMDIMMHLLSLYAWPRVTEQVSATK